MPFLKNDSTVITDVGVATSKNYDYNLDAHNSYATSVQLIYTNATGLTATADIEASNDGETFVSLTGSPVSLTVDGSSIWDVTNTSFRVLRVAFVHSAGSVDLKLSYHSINLH